MDKSNCTKSQFNNLTFCAIGFLVGNLGSFKIFYWNIFQKKLCNFQCQIGRTWIDGPPNCFAVLLYDWTSARRRDADSPAYATHRCFLGSIWLQWILTVPNDHGNWENQYEICLTWFHWANFEICLSQDFKRVLKKYLMPRSRMTFDPIFGIFGIFYDLCYPLFDQKVPICR